MLIGIDGNEANIENRVGVNEYAFQIIWGLWRLINDKNRADDPIDITVFLKSKPLAGMPPETVHFTYEVLGGGGMWIITKLMPHLFLTSKTSNKPQVFFTPSHYIPPFAPQPRVCSIMDLGYLVFSGQFRKYDFWQLKLWSAWSMMWSKRIIAISGSTKDDIVRHYPDYAKKTVVTPLGFDGKVYNNKTDSGVMSSIRKLKSKYSIVNSYILFLGTLKPSKNVEGLIEAWGKIVNAYPDFTLVIGGKKGWFYDEIFTKVKSLGLSKKVIFTDYIPEKEKPFLIKGASLFVIPSFWEGFGIDALTSMASGVPVVASNCGSLPGVVGNAGLIIDPYNTTDIASKVSDVLSMNKKEYNNLVKRGLAQAKKFSWERASQITLETLVEAAKK